LEEDEMVAVGEANVPDGVVLRRGVPGGTVHRRLGPGEFVAMGALR
jgi:hypothetical protein